jgi:RNA polymerase sigma factor (TIGR02999 family)
MVDEIRKKRSAKRQAPTVIIEVDSTPGVDVEALDAALDKLATLDAEQARLVELRFFGGLTVEETAEAMSISPATVKRHWAIARAWLARELEGNSPA